MSDKPYKIQTQRERAPGYWESTRGYYDLIGAIEWCADIGFNLARIIKLDDEGDWDESTVEIIAVMVNGKMFFLPGTGVPTHNDSSSPLPMEDEA